MTLHEIFVRSLHTGILLTVATGGVLFVIVQPRCSHTATEKAWAVAFLVSSTASIAALIGIFWT